MSKVHLPGHSTLRGVFIGLLGLLFCVAGDAFSALGAESGGKSPFAPGALGAIFGGLFLAGYATVKFGLAVRSSRHNDAAEEFRRMRTSAGSVWWPIACLAVSGVFYLPLLVGATQRVGSFATVIAVAFCGPLGLAVSGALRKSRYIAVAWPVLAGAGLWVMSLQEEAHTDWLGYAFAAVAAICFAVNVSAVEKLEDRGAETVGLALAGLLTIPGAACWLIVGGLDWFQPRVIVLAVLTGLLTACVAPVLEARAIGHLGKEKFGVLSSGEPIMSLPVGLLLLGEVPGWFVVGGVLLIVVAIVGNTAELERPLVRRLRSLKSKGPRGARRLEKPAVPAVPAATVVPVGAVVPGGAEAAVRAEAAGATADGDSLQVVAALWPLVRLGNAEATRLLTGVLEPVAKRTDLMAVFRDE